MLSPDFDFNVREEMDSGGTADKSLKKRFSQDFYLFHDFSVNMYSVIINIQILSSKKAQRVPKNPEAFCKHQVMPHFRMNWGRSCD